MSDDGYDPRIYNRQGEKITTKEWSKLLGDIEYQRVAITTLPSGRWISTVWLGLDHSFSFDGTATIPLIFETMVFNGGDMMDEYMERYSTEAEAQEGHERIAAMVRELEEVNGSTRHADPTPGEPGSDSEEDQERDHGVRPTANVGNGDDPQHAIRPPRSCE